MDTIKMQGRYRIELRDAKTGELLRAQCFSNQLTDIDRTVRAQMLTGTYEGTADALAIKYFAFGNGASTGPDAPASTDTQLTSEIYRKQLTKITEVSPGVVQSIVSLGSLECNELITEIGVFAGPGASAAPNTGTLLSRVAVNIEKNSNLVLNVFRTDTCSI